MSLPFSISVIVVNFQSFSTLRRCLDALRVQTLAPECVVLIDNSRDRECAALQKDYPYLLVECLGQNLGFAAANNRGVAMCQTEFVALLNPDAFPEPDWLEKLINAAKARPDCAAFGSLQLMDSNPELIDGMGDVYHFSGVMWREAHGQPRSKIGPLTMRSIFSPCAAAALYRREAFLEVGGFDEDFFCYCEDVDLGFRLRLAGWESALVPDAVVRHTVSSSSGGERSDFATYHGHRNMVWVFIKNMPGILLWFFLPLHILVQFAAMFVLTLRGQILVGFRAKIDALKGLTMMWGKRQTIQSNRIASIMKINRSIFLKSSPNFRGVPKT